MNVFLPVEPSAPAFHKTVKSFAGDSIGKKTVAIIEDDSRTRRLVKDLLDASPELSCVAQFASADAALGALPALKPDIIVTDVNLPGVSGIACVRHLKPKMPSTLFVILTVCDDAETIFDALRAGAVGFILKRDIASGLTDALLDAAGGGSPMSSSVAREVVRSFQTTARNTDEIANLSERERQVLTLLARGQLYKEIAESLAIAQNTVHSYIRRIYEKLHVRSRMEAVAKLGPVAMPKSNLKQALNS